MRCADITEHHKVSVLVKKSNLTGVIPPLITPMNTDGNVDEPVLTMLIVN